MSKFSIIKNAKKLGESLGRQKTARDEYKSLLHVNAVSVLVRTNAHGSVSEINRFHQLLDANEQTAFRTYVRRFQESGKDADGKPVKTELAFLTFKGEEWRIDTETPTEQRRPGSPFQKYAEKVLINPDGKTAKFFWDTDNVQDAMQMFDDKSVLDGIKRLLTTVQNGSTDKRKVVVSDDTVKFLTQVATQAETLRTTLNVEDQHKSNVVQLHGAPHQKPENIEAAQTKRSEKPAEKPANGRRRANQAAKQAASA